MKPVFRLLNEDIIKQIIAEAKEILWRLGLDMAHDGVRERLVAAGSVYDTDSKRLRISPDQVDRALQDAPGSFCLYDALGKQTHDFSPGNVHFTPGSAALNILDNASGKMRKPLTADYVQYAKVVSQLQHIASQSTAFIPADVPEAMSDSYRLYLSLRYCAKPVVTGAFTMESFAVMRDMQLIVRGDAQRLREKPLTIFSCCPTSPLKWSQVTAQNLVDCAENGIPVEFISMPLCGFMAPVTLVGSVIQHTAETLSGLVISQTVQPGTPILYGGSPALFDIRYETTPMGAVETQMIDCAYSEVGRYLNLPTQAYISLSDAKMLDAQAGLESAMGATLAALAGINNISGPGMLDFESCQSVKKLILDNEICGMALRLARGIEPREDFPSLPLFQQLLDDKHLLIADHSLRHRKLEHYLPGPVIDRSNHARWQAEGALTLGERAGRQIDKLLAGYTPWAGDSMVKDLHARMAEEASSHGAKLPAAAACD